MLIVHVTFDIKPEYIKLFQQASMINVTNSLKEVGVAGFELLHSSEEDTRFMLMEQYKTKEDQLAHRETLHFKMWKETITPMLQKPYTFSKWDLVIPVSR